MVAKRQFRYNTPALLAENIPQLLGKKVNIVFKDQRVLMVTLVTLSGDRLELKDTRLDKATVAVSDIAEIIVDERG